MIVQLYVCITAVLLYYCCCTAVGLLLAGGRMICCCIVGRFVTLACYFLGPYSSIILRKTALCSAKFHVFRGLFLPISAKKKKIHPPTEIFDQYLGDFYGEKSPGSPIGFCSVFYSGVDVAFVRRMISLRLVLSLYIT